MNNYFWFVFIDSIGTINVLNYFVIAFSKHDRWPTKRHIFTFNQPKYYKLYIILSNHILWLVFVFLRLNLNN
jgi:hypothetical protein